MVSRQFEKPRQKAAFPVEDSSTHRAPGPREGSSRVPELLKERDAHCLRVGVAAGVQPERWQRSGGYRGDVWAGPYSQNRQRTRQDATSGCQRLQHARRSGQAASPMQPPLRRRSRRGSRLPHAGNALLMRRSKSQRRPGTKEGGASDEDERVQVRG